MVRIRRAKTADAAEISALILGEASHITLRPDGAGAETILASMQVPAIEANLASSRFSYWVSCDGNHINGVIGLRDGTHLHHMFVPTRLHRNGIASRLWRQLLVAQAAKSDPTPITVNASPFAVPVYKRFGFEPTGERTETNGIAFIPMQYTFSTSTIEGAHMTTKYTEDHEWIQVDGDIATVGITVHAQDALGDVVFVDLPEVGKSFEQKDIAGVVESVKAAADVYMPVSGEITEVNEALRADPSLANSDPMNAGWFFKVKLSAPAQVDALLDETAYAAFAA